MTEPQLQVQMLGGLSLALDGEPIGPLPSRPASLLAYLILHRDRDHTRDLLAGRFWSDTSDDKARRRLSQALWRIRSLFKEVGIEALVGSSNTIRFNPEIDVDLDVETFEAELDGLERERPAVSPARLSSVVDRYRGELLAGHYDEWIGEDRERLRDRYRGGLGLLIRLATKQGDYEAALRHALALVADDPLDEENQREVLRLYAMTNRVTAAERHYKQFVKHFKEQLEIEPSEETAKLMRSLLDDSGPPVSFGGTDHASSTFVGHRQERSTVLRAVIDLAAGKGGILLIEGEAGVGKSRLIEELGKGAEWREVTVLVGRHDETSVLTPYDGLRQAIAPALTGLRRDHLVDSVEPLWLVEAGEVLDDLRALVTGGDRRHRLEPAEEPWRTTEALAQVILAQGRPKPTVFILEDVHLCDRETMAVLAQLGDRLLDAQVLLCLTYRLDEARLRPPVWDMLSGLEAEPGATRVRVPPLEPDEARELVAAELGPGRLPAAVVDQVIEATGGNPYMILELVRSPIEIGDDGATGGRWLEDELRTRLSATVGRRVDATPPEVRSVLDVVAAVGGPTPSGIVAKIVDLDRPAALDALQRAVDLDFLVDGPRGCSFAHSQTRQLVYDAIASRRRRGLHGRIADVLASSGEPSTTTAMVAHHAWLGEQWQRAYQYHSLAADSAMMINAFQISAEHLDKADQAALWADIDDGDRIDELLDAERVFDLLGERARQRRLIERVTTAGPLTARQELRVQARQASLLLHDNRLAEAEATATEAVATARRTGQNAGDALTIVATIRIRAGQRTSSVEPLSEAIDACRDAGVSALPPQLMLGRIQAELGEYDAAQQVLEGALEEAKDTDDARNQVEALGHLAAMWASRGAEGEADAAYRSALQEAQRIGYRDGEGKNLLNLAVFNLRRGRSGRADALLDRARVVYEDLDDDRGLAYVMANLSWVQHWIVGDDVAAKRNAEGAAVQLRRLGDAPSEAVCLSTLGGIELRAGRRRQARNRMRHALNQAASAEDRLTETKALVGLAIVELELGNATDAVAHGRKAMELGAAHRLDLLVPLSMAVVARALAELDQPGEAVTLVEQVIAANGPAAELSHLAAWWSAEILASEGRHDDASEQVARAHALLSRNLEELPKPAIRRSWTEVPEHRAIAVARERYFVEKVKLRLPVCDAPTGRRLAPEEFVTVTLTRSHPDDWDLESASERRHRRLLRLIDEATDQGTRVRQIDLARLLGVSERTIKRDLAVLRAEA